MKFIVSVNELDAATQAKFNETNSLRLKRLLPLNPEEPPRIIDNKETVAEIKKWDNQVRFFLQKNQDEGSTSKYIPFIYHAFRNHIELEKTPSHCMLCLKEGKQIAGSHYVSNAIWKHVGTYFVGPGNNDPIKTDNLTLPLFCTGKKNECEQMLSGKGETDFANKFLPFIKKMRERISLGSEISLKLDYDSWFFYTIISLAYRLMLVDFGENNADLVSIHTETDNEAQEKAIPVWRFFNKCREYLLNGSHSNDLHIGLFFSENGLHSSSIKEHPIVQQVTYVDQLDNSGFFPHVLFGITGAHFVVTENESLLNAFESELTKKSQKIPFARIKSEIGSIELNLGKVTFDLPEKIKEGIACHGRHVAEEMGSRNPEITLSKIKSNNFFNTESKPVFALPIHKPSYTIQLPQGIRFISTQFIDPEYGWPVGNLEFTGNQFARVAIDIYKPPVKFASWLIKHKYQNFFFVIVQSQNDDGQNIVCAYDFDNSFFSSEYLLNLEKIKKTDFKLKPYKGTDHSLSGIMTEDGDEKIPINFAISRLFMAYHSTYQLSVNPPYMIEDLKEIFPNVTFLAKFQKLLISFEQEDYKSENYNAVGSKNYDKVDIVCKAKNSYDFDLLCNFLKPVSNRVNFEPLANKITLTGTNVYENEYQSLFRFIEVEHNHSFADRIASYLREKAQALINFRPAFVGNSYSCSLIYPENKLDAEQKKAIEFLQHNVGINFQYIAMQGEKYLSIPDVNNGNKDEDRKEIEKKLSIS